MLIILIIALMSILSLIGYFLQKNESSANWGSFTAEKTYSYDEKFYAVQSTKKIDNVRYVVVSVYSADNKKFLYSFTPARAFDFWGICWENDTYNIWIQSADIGIYCYKYEDDQWKKDISAERPDYIKSKYD